MIIPTPPVTAKLFLQPNEAIWRIDTDDRAAPMPTPEFRIELTVDL